MRAWWIGLVVLGGCGETGGGGVDQGMPDVALARDLAERPDLSQAVDAAQPADLAMAPDLTTRDAGGGGGGGQGPNAMINCGNVTCAPPKGACCRGQAFGMGSCVGPAEACGQFKWFCDNSADCANPGDVCCITFQGAECRTVAACNQLMGRAGCQKKDECPINEACCGVGPSPEYQCQPGPCPISRRRHKDDIHYLDDGERRHLHQALVNYRLTTWRYKRDPSRAEHLGFLIDDVIPSPAVAHGGETVDLYGYTSMAVAAIQEQARQIAELRQELRALRRQVSDGQRRRR